MAPTNARPVAANMLSAATGAAQLTAVAPATAELAGPALLEILSLVNQVDAAVAEVLHATTTAITRLISGGAADDAAVGFQGAVLKEMAFLAGRALVYSQNHPGSAAQDCLQAVVSGHSQ